MGHVRFRREGVRTDGTLAPVLGGHREPRAIGEGEAYLIGAGRRAGAGAARRGAPVGLLVRLGVIARRTAALGARGGLGLLLVLLVLLVLVALVRSRDALLVGVRALPPFLQPSLSNMNAKHAYLEVRLPPSSEL